MGDQIEGQGHGLATVVSTHLVCRRMNQRRIVVVYNRVPEPVPLFLPSTYHAFQQQTILVRHHQIDASMSSPRSASLSRG